MKKRSHTLKKAFAAAFPYTIPIFAGFWFLGLTYGIYMNVSGFSFWYHVHIKQGGGNNADNIYNDHN